jgi:hypothetical protein
LKNLVVNVRANELPELAELFASEQVSQDLAYFWQDRSARFLSPYQLFQSGSANYIGVKEGKSWIACGGQVPMSIHLAKFKSAMVLETDFMVRPDVRHKLISAEMARFRLEDFAKNGSSNTIHWGIENIPGSFSFSERVAAASGCEYAFRWNSTLHQIFLTANAPEPAGHAMLLSEASLEQRRRFIHGYSAFAEARALSAKVDDGIFSRILTVDPEAQIIYTDAAAAILFSSEALNCFRFTGRTSLLLERLRRRRGLSRLTNEVFRLGLLTLSWYREGHVADCERVLRQATRESYLRGWDCLSVRDEPEEFIPSLSPDILSFPRRVFLVTGPQNPEFASIHQWLAEDNPQIKIDVASL